MRFTDIFIKRPVLALVVSLLILLIGLKAMLGLQIRQYPRLFNTTITVTTAYPGASPDILGGQTFAMRLWLDPARMAASGISANDVALAIRANNYQSAPGQAKGFYTVTNVEAGTGLVNVEQFKRMVVKSSKEAVVRLEDIATVALGPQSWTTGVAMNGQHAVFIGIQATPTANPLSIVAGIRGLLPEIQRNLPPSV